jgi:hypothetical protein
MPFRPKKSIPKKGFHMGKSPVANNPVSGIKFTTASKRSKPTTNRGSNPKIVAKYGK